MPAIARVRFEALRTMEDGALRVGVLAAESSDRLWAFKNSIADNMVMACGFGGPVPLLDIPEYPVTIFVRPGGDPERLELFTWDPLTSAGTGFDYADFAPVADVPAVPMFGAGGLHMFMTQERGGAKHYFVRAHDPDGGTRDSDLIRSKIESAPTRGRSGALRMSPGAQPTFQWPRFVDPGLWISFLMVLEGPERTLRTGVYSWSTRWRFPEIRHVPFFYHDPDPTPTLTPGQEYEAVYAAVDSDRWIRYADSLKFIAP